MITVRLPELLREGRGDVVTMSAATLGEVIVRLGWTTTSAMSSSTSP